MNYFDERIAFFKKNLEGKEGIFRLLSDELLSKNLVKEDFFEGIINREQVFPTGLVIGGIGVAIPHTDSIYVERSQVAFMSLEKPIIFYEMGSIDKEIEVQLIFMLALKEPHEQLSMLQKLIDMFQKKGVLSKFLEIEHTDQFIKIIQENGLG